jgi:hypothetical protein
MAAIDNPLADEPYRGFFFEKTEIFGNRRR